MESAEATVHGGVFHIAEPEVWADALRTGQYRAASLTTEGFIHCSSPAQVLVTAQRYYAGRRGLVLIEIETMSLPLRWEASTNGEHFPHVYGPIPRAAVVAVHSFEPDAEGAYSLP